MIQRECMYCGKDMGTIDGKGMTGVSHGICPACDDLPEAEQMALYNARKLKSFLFSKK